MYDNSKKTLSTIALTATALLMLQGCVPPAVSSVTTATGKKVETYSLFLQNDHRHILYRYPKLMYDKGLRMNASMINVAGSNTVTLKVEEYQIHGRDFTLHPITLNGIKPLSCKKGKIPGRARRTLECTYNKAAIRNSVIANQKKGLNGLIVDESPNGTLSEAWKCSQKYYPAYQSAGNVFGRMRVRNQFQRECMEPIYFPGTVHSNPLALDGIIENRFSYRMAAAGNKHYRFSVDKDNKKFLEFLSK